MILNLHGLLVIDLKDPPDHVARYARFFYGWSEGPDDPGLPRVEVLFSGAPAATPHTHCCGRSIEIDNRIFWRAWNGGLIEYPLGDIARKRERVTIVASPSAPAAALFRTFIYNALRRMLVRRNIALVHACGFALDGDVVICPCGREPARPASSSTHCGLADYTTERTSFCCRAPVSCIRGARLSISSTTT